MKKLIVAFLLFAFVHVSFASPPMVDAKQKTEKATYKNVAKLQIIEVYICKNANEMFIKIPLKEDNVVGYNCKKKKKKSEEATKSQFNIPIKAADSVCISPHYNYRNYI